MMTLTLLAAFIGFTPLASAMGRGSGPCEPAMDEFCGGLLEISHAAVMNCLKENEAHVAPACQEVLKSWTPLAQPGQPEKKSTDTSEQK
jgi:hypothetical protein